MKNLARSLNVDLHRAFISPFFAVAVALVVILCYISVVYESSILEPNIVYLFEIFILSGMFSLVFLSLGVIPFGISFCMDWKNQFIKPYLIRTSYLPYAWSKVISVAVSGLSAYLLGCLLTMLLFSINMPMLGADYYEIGYIAYSDTIFGPLIDINPLLYLFVRIILSALSISFWAVVALVVSTYVTNIFVTLATPIIAQYFFNSIIRALNFPLFLRPSTVVDGITGIENPFLSTIYAFCFFATLIAAMGVLFTRRVRKRLNNG